MTGLNDNLTIAEILGPWKEQEWESGLIERCRNAWNKPLRNLTNEELATLLRQRIAVEYLLPIAEKRIDDGTDDETEMYEGELADAIQSAK
jgi:CDI immunity proteins